MYFGACMKLSKVFIHDLRNDLLIMKYLVKKMNIENESTAKLNKVIDSVADKCQMALAPVYLHNGFIDINQIVKEATTYYSDILFNFAFDEKLELIASKTEFCDVIKNIIKNSIESGASVVNFETKFNTLTIRDDGNCTSEVVDNLNDSVIFSTKDLGYGIGTQSVKQFCTLYGLRILYSKILKGDSKENNYSLIIRIKFP